MEQTGKLPDELEDESSSSSNSDDDDSSDTECKYKQNIGRVVVYTADHGASFAWSDIWEIPFCTVRMGLRA